MPSAGKRLPVCGEVAVVDGDARGALRPGLAWVVPTAFLCLLLPARTGVAVSYRNGPVGAAFAVALFALPLLYTVPRGRVVWERYPWWLLSAQAVLTCVPFVLLGKTWVVGLSGLLGGLVLLTVRAPLSYLLLVGVIAVEGVVRIGVYGAYPATGMQYYTWVFVVPIDMALPLFGLVRLSDLVAELHAARTELAGSAVTRERLNAAVSLRAAVGDRLAAVTVRATAGLAALPHSPDRAGSELAEAGRVARRAAEDVRLTVTRDRPVHGPPALRRTGRMVEPRLARLVLVVDMSVFAVHHVMIAVDSAGGAVLTGAAVAAIASIAALQLYHSLAGRHGARPHGWRLTLPVQALLPFTDYANASLLGLPGFPAGSALLLLRGWRAWAVFAVISPSMAAYWLLRKPSDVGGAVYLAGLSASTALAVYGLSRLGDLAERLEAIRQELAWAAVEQERLRVTKDTHDLLGLGLSAIALRCDLAVRLIGRDDTRARVEVRALLSLVAQTHADVRAVTAGEQKLSLSAELAAARDVLATAGVRVMVRTPAPGKTLPVDVDAVLATVLREAVTNVVRHSEATWCELELTAGPASVSLRIVNDGVCGAAAVREQDQRAGGHGLANMTGRAVALGGQLTTGIDGDRFELVAQLPVDSGRPVRLDALAAGGLAHGVDEVVGGRVLDEET